jgi:16S rRNA (cytidine1402-2'-O)-methyltransferase
LLVLVGAPLAPGDGLSDRAAAAAAGESRDGGSPGGTPTTPGPDGVLARLAAGERVVVVVPPDAAGVDGLVAAAIAAGHAVEHVPGPSAALAALAVSGLPTARFVVEHLSGPPTGPELAALAAEPRTAVLVVGPERLAGTVAGLAAACGPDRRCAVVVGDAVWRGAIGEAALPDGTAAAPAVVVLAGAPASAPPSDADVLAAVEAELAAGATARDAARAVAARLAVPRRRAYDLAVAAASRPR